jgi:LytS/YehU family sensor histidine kinase
VDALPRKRFISNITVSFSKVVPSICTGNKPGAFAIEKRGMGIGLGNVAERVKAYFGRESNMRIDSVLGNGTSCSLIIDLKENGDA